MLGLYGFNRSRNVVLEAPQVGPPPVNIETAAAKTEMMDKAMDIAMCILPIVIPAAAIGGVDYLLDRNIKRALIMASSSAAIIAAFNKGWRNSFV